MRLFDSQLLAVYEKTVLVAFEEVENALVSYSRELVRRGSLQAGTDAATRAVELATERYARGLTGFQDVLDAQRQLFLLQDDLALIRIPLNSRAKKKQRRGRRK